MNAYLLSSAQTSCTAKICVGQRKLHLQKIKLKFWAKEDSVQEKNVNIIYTVQADKLYLEKEFENC